MARALSADARLGRCAHDNRRVFWLPFITITASVLGGALESLLGGNRSLLAWGARLIAPAVIGAAWLAVTGGISGGARMSLQFVMYAGFSVPAWVGMWAVHLARSERGE